MMEHNKWRQCVPSVNRGTMIRLRIIIYAAMVALFGCSTTLIPQEFDEQPIPNSVPLTKLENIEKYTMLEKGFFIYPRKAFNDGAEAIVFVTFNIDKNGVPFEPRILKYYGLAKWQESFSRQAAKMVLRSRFAPAKLNGQPVEIFNVTYAERFCVNEPYQRDKSYAEPFCAIQEQYQAITSSVTSPTPLILH